MRFLKRKSKVQNNPKSTKPTAVYAFIDSQNLNLGTQRAGWKMDWRKFRQFLGDKYGVTHAYMFIGYISDNEDLYNQLHESGYLVVLKPTVETSGTDDDADKKPVVKGNIDAELVLYAMKEMPNYAQSIIVSGDGDFYCLAEYLESKARLKAIMTPNWRYSSLLKPYEKYIVRLDQKRSELEHIDKKGTKRGRQAKQANQARQSMNRPANKANKANKVSSAKNAKNGINSSNKASNSQAKYKIKKQHQ